LEEEEEEAGGHGHGGEFKMDEIVIHQIIETIEYVLGTVSHTASYLRLWALSLAHQQLSLVFFQKTILGGLSMDFPMNGIFLYFMYGSWLGITCGVLLGMDVLECFLHDLRLHWVEFQSKFYNVGGDGHMFTPYKHEKVLAPKAA
jgi:V-type H+-transporting ATPase subunit a